MKGKVKFFVKSKGYGFVVGEDEKEYFVHITGLTEGTVIDENDTVEFKAVKSDRGMKAEEVKLISADSGSDNDLSDDADEEAE